MRDLHPGLHPLLEPSIVLMNRRSDLTAAAPSPGTSSGAAASSHTVSPVVLAWASSRDTVVLPIPRRGELTIR